MWIAFYFFFCNCCCCMSTKSSCMPGNIDLKIYFGTDVAVCMIQKGQSVGSILYIKHWPCSTYTQNIGVKSKKVDAKQHNYNWIDINYEHFDLVVLQTKISENILIHLRDDHQITYQGRSLPGTKYLNPTEYEYVQIFLSWL